MTQKKVHFFTFLTASPDGWPRTARYPAIVRALYSSGPLCVRMLLLFGSLLCSRAGLDAVFQPLLSETSLAQTNWDAASFAACSVACFARTAGLRWFCWLHGGAWRWPMRRPRMPGPTLWWAAASPFPRAWRWMRGATSLSRTTATMQCMRSWRSTEWLTPAPR